MKNILFVSSEAVPYIKTGGLADVVGSLPRFYNKREYDVRIMIPKYACMDASFLSEMRFLCHFYVDLNWRRQYVGIFKAVYKGITYYLVDNEFYFAGEHPYHNIYEDVEKFAYFSKAVLQALPYIDFQPDILHCHDWQTGLVPVFLHTCFGSDPYYERMKTVFTIHNMKFQGRWKIQEVMDITGLPSQIFNANELESYGEANYLKGGIVYSDYITTVSPSYAYDITTIEGGEGLEGLMYARKDFLTGIVNGIDYEEYNPMTDPYLTYHFSAADSVEGKRQNKRKLQEGSGLSVSENTFLIGIVSRMTDQKGMDLIAYIMDELLSTMNVQVAALGTGESRYENMFLYFQNKFPGKVSVHVGYSEEKAHQIYASCDALLMPSLFEPCGLSQLMAMRYGTIPIVRETGGLKDTVIPFNEYEHSGTGFSFGHFNADELMGVIRYAYRIFEKDKVGWQDMVCRDMKEDFSWETSACKYEQLYEQMIVTKETDLSEATDFDEKTEETDIIES